MLVIRFLRTGKKNQPSFKIVVTEKKNPPAAGRFVEQVGFYNPLTKEKVLKQDRIKYWISVGAQPSDTVHNLLISEKIIEGKKIAVHKKSKKIEEDKSSSSPSPSKEDSEKEEKPAEEKTTEAKPSSTEAPLEEDKSSSRPSPSEEGSEKEEPKKEEKKEEKPTEAPVKEESKPKEKKEHKKKEAKPEEKPAEEPTKSE